MSAPPNLAGTTALVVSADAERRAGISNAMAESGCRVAHAATGGEALAQASREAPDLAVLDHDVGDMGAPELCRRLKEGGTGAAIQIVQAPEAGREDIVDRALECGADAFVTAPVDERILLVTARTVVAAQRACREAAPREREEREAQHRLQGRLEEPERPDTRSTAERAFLEAVLQQMPAGVIVAEAPSGAIAYLNTRAGLISGIPVERLAQAGHYAGLRAFRADGSEYSPDEWPLVRALRRGEVVTDEEMLLVRPDGSHLTVLANAAPIRDREGAVVAGVVVFRDITERKQQRQELEHLLERERARAREGRLLEAILDNAPIGVGYFDREFRYVRVNPMYEQVVGHSRQELMKLNLFDLVLEESVRDFFRRARDRGEATRREEMPYQFVGQPERGTTYLNVAVAPVKDEGGEVVGLVLALLDQTAQVETRERLLAAERTRARLAETASAEIAHRVRNNLTMVTGLIHMQLLREKDPAAAAALRDALTRVLAIAGIHEQLDATTLESIDLSRAVRSVAQAISRTSAHGRVEVSVEGEPLFYDASAAANVAAVVSELITNANKHGAPAEDGKLHVEVRLSKEDSRLRVSVWNSGDTLPPDFDPSRQQGLGLRILRDVVEGQSGGSFTLTRHRGGTQAEFTIDEAALRQP